MNVASHSIGETKALLENKDGGKTYTRVSVLRDFKGSHVLLQKRKSLIRRNDLQPNHDSTLWKNDDKCREKQNYVHANSTSGKFENVKSIEGIKDLGKDGLSKNENIDQEHEKKMRTFNDGAALIDQYFETGTLFLNESNVFRVLRLAFELRLMDVYNACNFFLSHSLTIGNCIEVWRLSKIFHSYTLTQQAMNFMDQHLTTSLLRKDQVSVATSLINSAKDLHSLEFLLQIFLSHKYEKTAKTRGSITELFSELMKRESMIWRYYFKEYLQQFEDLKQGKEDASQTSNKPKEIASNKWTKQRNTDISMMSELVMSREGKIELDNLGNATTLENHNEKPMERKRKGILVAGGINDQTHEALDRAFMYEPEADTWTALPSLTHARFNHTMVNLNGKVYAMGGKRQSSKKTHYLDVGRTFEDNRNMEQEHGLHTTMSCDDSHQLGVRVQKFIKMTNCNQHISISPNNSFTSHELKESCENSWIDNNQMSSVEFFSTELNKWCETSSMILHRKEHSSVVVGNFAYVIGGHDGVTQLCSIENYDQVKDEWRLEKPMSRLCTGMNVVTDRQFLYVIGGYSGKEWLNTLSCYDTRTKTWNDNKYPTMKTGRAFAGAELVNKDIFVFGGVNSQGCLDKFEVFNLKSKTWRQGPCMNQPRCNAGHCVFQNKIFVFGGEACGKLLETVEYLDIEKWEWKKVKKMPMRTGGLRCVQVDIHS